MHYLLAAFAICGSDRFIPCFDPPEDPTNNQYMACFSTGTFFGGSAAGGMRSDITSNPIVFTFRPDVITVSFSVDFQTEESAGSVDHNDAFQARLVTSQGSFPIVQIDTFGHTPVGRGLTVDGFRGFTDTASTCPLHGKRTHRLKVSWKRPIDFALRLLIGTGPVFLEFSIWNQGDTTRT